MDDFFIGSCDDREYNHAHELDYNHVVHFDCRFGAIITIPNRRCCSCDEVECSCVYVQL
jgi:hypothetical protein